MNRRHAPLLIVLAALLVAPAAAAAGGGVPTKGVVGSGITQVGNGIADSAGAFRYTAVPAGAGTTVGKIEIETGRVEQFTFVDRQLVIPAVAYDGSAGGLSADGETLVLATPAYRFPQRTSDFTVLDTDNLRVRERLSLDGTYTYDALSPDGRSLYLIEYTSRRDLSQYLVREYDLRRDRFHPEPIIDPNESAEEMYGTPVTRTTSPDGRWEYTLYDGQEHPFIHALDTERGKAVCIDLESVHRVAPFNGDRLEISPNGATLTVMTRKGPAELVDTRTFEVEPAPAPADEAPPGPAQAAADGGGDLTAWALIGGGLVLLTGAITHLVRRRRTPAGEAALEHLGAIEENGAGAGDERERERDPVA